MVFLGIPGLFSCSFQSCSKNAVSSVRKLTWQEFTAIYYYDILPGDLKAGDTASVEFTIVAMSAQELPNRNMYVYSVVPVSGEKAADTAGDNEIVLLNYGFFDTYPDIVEKGEMNEKQNVELIFEIVDSDGIGDLDFNPLEIRKR
jgi:hypothetical protein